MISAGVAVFKLEVGEAGAAVMDGAGGVKTLGATDVSARGVARRTGAGAARTGAA